MKKKQRLDVLVYERGLAVSRERARTEIMSGNVLVNGQRQDKPGMPTPDSAEIRLREQKYSFVSRGGLKLEKALQEFDINPLGKLCADFGASTGGFTDCLLRAGASRVYAVDVGYGQLAWSLRTDSRVVSLERTNVRYITREQIADEIELIVIDVSFISLKLILPAVSAILTDNGDVICLIKPQFEAGKENVGKKGVVRDSAIHKAVINNFIDYSRESGFKTDALTYSPVKGPEGNIEYLAHLRRGTGETSCNISELVLAAREYLG